MVHPRVCGGSLRGSGARRPAAGASPRVRGKLTRGRGCRRGCGCIPACAGEAAGAGRFLDPEPVHPRVCGGSSPARGLFLSRGGASPRVRGKLSSSTALSAAARCIPACAGEAFRAPVRISRGTVHPRVCGGSCRQLLMAQWYGGASPRVRGKRGPTRAFRRSYRCIPACAGEADRSPAACTP